MLTIICLNIFALVAPSYPRAELIYYQSFLMLNVMKYSHRDPQYF
jgi:hypothetical protein